MPRLRALSTILAATAVLTAAGCSSSTGEVSKPDVENEVATQLAAKVNEPKPTITCPSGLTAKVGATLDCVLVAQGSTTRYNVHVTVTAIHGSRADFDIQVGSSPLP